jgi:hypothetical protein
LADITYETLKLKKGFEKIGEAWDDIEKKLNSSDKIIQAEGLAEFQALLTEVFGYEVRVDGTTVGVLMEIMNGDFTNYDKFLAILTEGFARNYILQVKPNIDPDELDGLVGQIVDKVSNIEAAIQMGMDPTAAYLELYDLLKAAEFTDA